MTRLVGAYLKLRILINCPRHLGWLLPTLHPLPPYQYLDENDNKNADLRMGVDSYDCEPNILWWTVVELSIDCVWAREHTAKAKLILHTPGTSITHPLSRIESRQDQDNGD